MAVRQARGVQARPGRVPRRGFMANGSAILWRTLCAATGGTGFGAGPRFHSARVRDFVAHTVRRYGGYGVGAGRTKCRDRSGEHCSPWPFVRRGAYRPGRDVPPPRFRGERVRDFVAHAVRRYRVAVRGAGRAPRRGLIPRGRCPTDASHPASPLHTILLRPNKHSFFLQNWFLLHNRRFR